MTLHCRQLGGSNENKASKLSNLIDIEYVLISPLRRALETSYHIFKDHPKFDKITFFVHPTFRENIMTAGDIPDDINKTIEEYLKLFPKFNLAYFPKLEYGDLDNLYYARNFLPEFGERIKGLKKVEADLVICEAISKRFPKSIEPFL